MRAVARTRRASPRSRRRSCGGRPRPRPRRSRRKPQSGSRFPRASERNCAPKWLSCWTTFAPCRWIAEAIAVSFRAQILRLVRVVPERVARRMDVHGLEKDQPDAAARPPLLVRDVAVAGDARAVEVEERAVRRERDPVADLDRADLQRAEEEAHVRAKRGSAEPHGHVPSTGDPVRASRSRRNRGAAAAERRRRRAARRRPRTRDRASKRWREPCAAARRRPAPSPPGATSFSRPAPRAPPAGASEPTAAAAASNARAAAARARRRLLRRPRRLQGERQDARLVVRRPRA